MQTNVLTHAALFRVPSFQSETKFQWQWRVADLWRGHCQCWTYSRPRTISLTLCTNTYAHWVCVNIRESGIYFAVERVWLFTAIALFKRQARNILLGKRISVKRKFHYPMHAFQYNTYLYMYVNVCVHAKRRMQTKWISIGQRSGLLRVSVKRSAMPCVVCELCTRALYAWKRIGCYSYITLPVC